MDPRHLDELITLEESYWWHVAKRALVMEVLARHFPPPGKLIEGGIGAGGNLAAFKKMGYDVTGFDLMQQSVEYCQKSGIGDVRVHNLAEPWPVEPGSARCVVMLDVIEHIGDPIAVLRNAANTLAPGGGIVITVPAGAYLMGPWDEALGHFRRYSRRMFADHARQANLNVRWCSCWNSFTWPAAIMVRMAARFRGGKKPAEFPRVPRLVNSMLIGAAAVERAILRGVRVPVGLSLVGVLTP